VCPSSRMTVIKTWMKNPIRGTASAIAASPKPTPSETHASRSIVPGLLVYFFRFRFGAASNAFPQPSHENAIIVDLRGQGMERP
jgi:hypothetical protein